MEVVRNISSPLERDHESDPIDFARDTLRAASLALPAGTCTAAAGPSFLSLGTQGILALRGLARCKDAGDQWIWLPHDADWINQGGPEGHLHDVYFNQ
jgi:hypothetical protein